MRWLLVLCTGCNVIFGFDDITPNPDALKADSGPTFLPVVAASPAPQPIAQSYYYVTGIKVTLAADDPATTIYYTTDGSTPTSASQNGPTPITGLSVASNEVITFYGVNGAGQSPIASDQYFFDATKQSNTGYIVQDVKLDGTSPVVDATRGQVFMNASAHVQMWIQSGCSGCATQLVYGVDSTDQGCLFDASPPLYPGSSVTKTFTLTAPMTPGTHEVRVANIEQTNCNAALAAHTLMTRPDILTIGVLVVR